MSLQNKMSRGLLVVILVTLLIHMFWAHKEQEKLYTALSAHQAAAINAYAEMNATIASGIAKRVEAQADNNRLEEKLRLESATSPTPVLIVAPTPTPKVIIRTKTHTKVARPSPKPSFHLFGPN